MSETEHDGREQKRRTPAAQAHEPNLDRYYRNHLPPITPGEFEFEVDLLRPREPPMSLDKMITALSWDDEQAALTGSVTLHRPDPEDPRTLPIVRGQLVRCRVRWDGRGYDLWDMRCQAPQIELDTNEITVTLQDDLAKLDIGKRDWWFRKTKAKRFGWTSDEIGRAVAARLGVRVRELAKGTTRFELKSRGVTGLAVLREAYAKEKAHAGRSFVIRMRNGELEVVPLRRNAVLYVLGPQIQTAQITQKAGKTVPWTVLTGHGRVKKGKQTRKVSFTEYDRRVVRQLGYVHHEQDYGRVDSYGDLRAKVRRDLAKALRLNDTITLTHQGIPFILRGDGVQLELPREGYSGEQSFVYVTRANHTVEAGVYTTSWDFTATDPYLAQLTADAKAQHARAAKRSKRSRSKLSGTVSGSG